MIKKRKKSNVLLIATLASILLMGIGTALADTIDKSYTFSFSGPLAMTYTAAYPKDTKSSMYISVTSTSDSSRSSFQIMGINMLILVVEAPLKKESVMKFIIMLLKILASEFLYALEVSVQQHPN